ncbi:dihydropteroate synthase, partial [Listeria monocytogenes]|nr:dihydropteroate synthase [Listeria monocytogenes]
IMGVLNVTPDSFSDGGRWLEPDAAVAHALELVAQGAALVAVGGESTRPGAVRVDPAEERARVVPVIRTLAGLGVTVSVDTLNAST